MNEKVLQKMYDKGYITEDELNGNSIITEERYDLFVAGVELLDGVVKTVKDQLKGYNELLGNSMIDQKLVKSQIKKLEKLLKKRGDNDAEDLFGVGTVKSKERKEKTQKAEVLRHLREEGFITSWEAFIEYGITRLSAIIYVLRHDEGMVIDTSTITKKNRYGNTVNFAKYSINERANI